MTSASSPFGMLMPNRSYSIGTYRFGFNTQEKDDEICGAGNTMTAEFWEYDTRLGRRWNLDPKPNFSVSNYSCFLNNPILFNDIKGDSGRYVNKNMQLLFVSNDNLPNSISVVTDEKEFNRLIASSNGDLNDDELNCALREISINYMIDDYRDFYKKHENDVSDWKPADGGGPLVNENAVRLKNVGGEMRLTTIMDLNGTPIHTDNLGTVEDPNLHTHPAEGRKFTNKESLGSVRTIETGNHSMLDDQISSTKQESNGLFDIVVIPNEIRFYNGVSIYPDQTIYTFKFSDLFVQPTVIGDKK